MVCIIFCASVELLPSCKQWSQRSLPWSLLQLLHISSTLLRDLNSGSNLLNCKLEFDVVWVLLESLSLNSQSLQLSSLNEPLIKQSSEASLVHDFDGSFLFEFGQVFQVVLVLERCLDESCLSLFSVQSNLLKNQRSPLGNSVSKIAEFWDSSSSEDLWLHVGFDLLLSCCQSDSHESLC